mmetsp:Transcript_21816/g.61752  ORF Transcript_21816/g.61752 Transcript_21816/m.61752 type:complete len:254 (-) Transcript_21816:850-1611(-)
MPGEGRHLLAAGRRRDGGVREVVPPRLVPGHLGVDAAKAIVGRRPLVVEVAAGADRVAGVAAGHGVARVDVPQQLHERRHVLHLALRRGSGEHPGSDVAAPTVLIRELGVRALHRGVASHLARLREVRDVETRPRALVHEDVRHVLAVRVAGHRLRHPQRVILQRLAGCELLVVDDHPLVVARAALVPHLRRHPLLACRRQTVRHHRPHPRQDALGVHALPEGCVVVFDARLEDSQALVSDIPVVAAVQRARI